MNRQQFERQRGDLLATECSVCGKRIAEGGLLHTHDGKLAGLGRWWLMRDGQQVDVTELSSTAVTDCHAEDL